MARDAVANRIRLGRWICGLNVSPQCPTSISTSADETATMITVKGFLQPISADPAHGALYSFTGPDDPKYQELLDEAKWMRRELTALIEYQRRQRRPIVFWIEADTYERMMVFPRKIDIQVNRFQLHTVGTKFESNGLEYTLQLERIGSESEIEFESRFLSSMRPTYWNLPFGGPIYPNSGALWAPPAEADVTWIPGSNQFVRLADTCSGHKNMRIFRDLPRTATLPNGRQASRRWSIDFEDPGALQWGACTIWHSGVNTRPGENLQRGRIALGRWMPNPGPTMPMNSWEVENGLIRMRQWTETVSGVVRTGVQISSFWQGAWSDWRNVWLWEDSRSRPVVAWKHMAILQNDEEQCRVRLVGATSLDYTVDRRVTCDIMLRRGWRHFEFVGHYPDATNNGFALSGAAVAQTPFSVVGVRSTGTIGGWRFPIITPNGLSGLGANDWDLANGYYRRDERSIPWAIGATPPGFSSSGNEGWEGIEAEYLGATTETVKTVRR